MYLEKQSLLSPTSIGVQNMGFQAFLAVSGVVLGGALILRWLTYSPPGPYWTCSRCGYDSNFKQSLACKACGTPK